MKKILIIDDEEEFDTFIKTNLELREDYEVSFALDGEEGLRVAKELKPDLILLDIMMPKMNGFEVLKGLRGDEKTKSIPVIMVTARSDDDSMIEALKLHDDGYIIKPVKIEELERKLEEKLET